MRRLGGGGRGRLVVGTFEEGVGDYGLLLWML